MTRLAFAIGLTIGLAIGYWLARKRREPAKPDAFADKMAKRADNLKKELQDIKDDRRVGRLS